MSYQCTECKDVFHYKDEVVFDSDELKVVDERNPDWEHATCNTCFNRNDVVIEHAHEAKNRKCICKKGDIVALGAFGVKYEVSLVDYYFCKTCDSLWGEI